MAGRGGKRPLAPAKSKARFYLDREVRIILVLQ